MRAATRMIRTSAAALLRVLCSVLIAIAAASCADLLIVARAGPWAAAPDSVPGRLTPEEQRAWTDLVARLTADA